MKTKTTFPYKYTIKRTLFCLVASFFSITITNAQTFAWAKSMGGSINEYGQAITVDGSGNVYTTGYFTGNVDFDPGVGSFTLNCIDNGDIFVSKLDGAGNFVWAKKMAGTGAGGDTGESITLDAAGNIYTTGRFSGTADFDPGAGTFTISAMGGYDIFISKLDASGNFVWAKSMKVSGADIGKSIKVDAAGNVYTCGSFQGTGDFDPGAGTYTLTSTGGDEIFVSKLDGSGNFVWAAALGGTGTDRCFGIDLDASGNVYTNGYAGGGDFDPGVGTFNLPIGLFVSKLDNSGNFVWAKQFTGAFVNYSYAIAVDASGNVYTTGTFQGSSATDFDPNLGTFNMTGGSGSMFISKLDAAGNFVWARSISGANGFSIKVDAANTNIYITGYFTGTNDFDPGTGTYTLNTSGNDDVFISQLDISGNFVNALSMGSINSDRATCIAVDAASNIYITGNYNGTVDFDPYAGIFNLSSVNSADIFVVKLNGLSTALKKENNLSNYFLSVYPNPFSTQITFKVKEISGNEVTIVIYNSVGQIVRTERSSSDKITILRENLTAGVYFYKATQEGNVIASGKLIAE